MSHRRPWLKNSKNVIIFQIWHVVLTLGVVKGQRLVSRLYRGQKIKLLQFSWKWWPIVLLPIGIQKKNSLQGRQSDILLNKIQAPLIFDPLITLWGHFKAPYFKMLNDARVESACLYVRTCQRVRHRKNIATIRDFQVYIRVNSTIISNISETHHFSPQMRLIAYPDYKTTLKERRELF